jgi:hypothetical protein
MAMLSSRSGVGLLQKEAFCGQSWVASSAELIQGLTLDASAVGSFKLPPSSEAGCAPMCHNQAPWIVRNALGTVHLRECADVYNSI